MQENNKIVTLTRAAVQEICRLTLKNHARALRLDLKKGGCAGMEYTMEAVQTIEPHDCVIEEGEACLLIAPKAQMFLFGTEIDYVSGLLESGFRFRNPNVTASCGCGESISFDIASTKSKE